MHGFERPEQEEMLTPSGLPRGVSFPRAQVFQIHAPRARGWSGGAMVLGKLPVPGRPTILITVGQGPIALAVGAGGGGLDIFTLICPFSSASPSLWEMAQYRLKYCLKGPLNPKQPTNQPTTSTNPVTDLHFDTKNNGCRIVLHLIT